MDILKAFSNLDKILTESAEIDKRKQLISEIDQLDSEIDQGDTELAKIKSEMDNNWKSDYDPQLEVIRNEIKKIDRDLWELQKTYLVKYTWHDEDGHLDWDYHVGNQEDKRNAEMLEAVIETKLKEVRAALVSAEAQARQAHQQANAARIQNINDKKTLRDTKVSRKKDIHNRNAIFGQDICY